MKKTNRFKAVLSIVLVITMLLSVGVIGMVGASADSSAYITYSFAYDNAGYAEGRVRLHAGSEADYGTYYLYWADDTKALDGYAPIKSLTLNQASRSFAMGEFTAIPADATKLIAIKSNTEPTVKTVASAAAVYDIPAEKQFASASSDKEYSFQALSDVHIQHDDSYWIYSKEHFANALETAADRDVDFVAICGDQVNGYGYSSLEKEWPMYLQIIADSSYTGPVYETNGNHEIKGDGGSLAQQKDHDIYKIGSGLNVTTEKMQNETYFELTAPSGDHLIFMTLENSGAPNEYSEFSDAQLDWLEGLLNSYKNDGHKVIIFQHALIKQYGAGDDLETPFYGGGLNTSFADVQRFIEILEANPDAIWFSGHSHTDFKYNYNISNMNGTTCYSVHIPSTSSTTHPNLSTGTNDYIMSPDSSQGYFVDVYADAVVLNGTDLVKNEIIPLYTYLVDYSGEELVKNTVDDEEDVYAKVSVTVDVSALLENPTTVSVYLYGADEETITEEVTMAKVEGGIYSASVSTEFTKMRFIVNGGKSAEYAVTGGTVVLSGTKVRVSLSEITDKNGASCTGWTTVNAYAWNNSSNQNEGSWPGTSMAKESNGVYVILLSGDANADKIIFNNGTSQTADLDIAPYIVKVEMPTEPSTTEPPTESTEPPTTEPQSTETEPQSTETEPQPTETEPVIEYLYGDADLNGIVNVKDATAVQKYAADLLELEGQAFVQANVSGDKAVNVRDATAIQKYVAGLITSFPAEKIEIAEVGASATEIEALRTTVKTALSAETYYASYEAYSALKKAYYADQSEASYYDNLNSALANYNTMKVNNPNHVGTSSGGSLGTGSTTNQTSVENITTKPSDGAYVIRGSFNNWCNGNPGIQYMKNNGDGTYSVSYQLTAGTYEFKFFNADTSAWYGNGGTMNPGDTGWTFKTDEASNCKMNATKDGIYTFTFYIEESSGKVKIDLTVA